MEGRFPWDRRKLGWTLKLGKKFTLPAYHFWLFFVMWPLMLTLPFLIVGWNLKLFGVLLSAYLSGVVVEDFMWYVVNLEVKLAEFGPKFVTYHPWLRVGKIHLPMLYVTAITASVLVWFFVWR